MKKQSSGIWQQATQDSELQEKGNKRDEAYYCPSLLSKEVLDFSVRRETHLKPSSLTELRRHILEFGKTNISRKIIGGRFKKKKKKELWWSTEKSSWVFDQVLVCIVVWKNHSKLAKKHRNRVSRTIHRGCTELIIICFHQVE